MFGGQRKSAKLPKGLRVFAIGDIHGRIDLLNALIDMIEAYDCLQGKARSILVFLGDYVDRGADSRGVIDYLLKSLPERFECVFLRGNHEDMLLTVLDSGDIFDVWAENGGLETVRSYGVNPDAINESASNIEFILRHLDAALPGSHRRFLDDLKISHQIGDYLFVHAGVRPGIALTRQHRHDCMYIRSSFLNHRGDFGKIIVHGHTPVKEPERHNNRIAIDTGAFFSGRLTAVCLEGESHRFLVADERNLMAQAGP